MNRPLILITNDDGVDARGLQTLCNVAVDFGDVVVMAPEHNLSGKSHSLTTDKPLRVNEIKQENGLGIFACDGTPADCVKLATEHFCPRQPDMVLSGINHGSNSSINVLYSGTMGAVLEATALGLNAVGFSLLNHNPQADFSACIPYTRAIIANVLEHGLPEGVALNVNIPRLEASQIKGMRICHQAKAKWLDCFEQRVDPRGRPYWWLTGKFVCDNPPDTSDEWALANGYVSVVPTRTDFTAYDTIDELKKLFE
jgi:5'-nucleotidase